MNASVNNLFNSLEEGDNRSQLSLLPIKSTNAGTAVKPASALQSSPDADDRVAFGARSSALFIESPAAAPEEALAIGVLAQAAHDLRRFHLASSGVERELFLDAYSWIVANDFSWPYSFVNVCQSLHVSPESMRTELLADVSLGWFGHWVRLGERLSHSLRDSLLRVFTDSRNANSPEPGRSAQAFQQL
jgi:hypothetical protein